MSIEFVGMVFPNQWSETRGTRITNKLDLEYLRYHAHAHEYAGFDKVLIANSAASPDSTQIAAFLAQHTERLGFMIAHRPAIQTPNLAARSFATLDHLTGGGRIRLHAITGITAEPQEGDFITDKIQRYKRTNEYLEIINKLWHSDEPFNYEGEFFHIENAFIPLKPVNGHIPISFGGSSDIAYEIAVQQANLYSLWGEPLTGVKEQIDKLKAAAAKFSRPVPEVSLSVRLIIGETEELAWKRAEKILADIQSNPLYQANNPNVPARPKGTGSLRLLAAAERGDRHDRALWMPTAKAVGAYGDTTALVGTPDTIIESLLDYVDLGVTTFLNRGYDPIYDTVDYGRYIIPAVREEAEKCKKKSA
ncbi:LLM class flavin-dependent oxidoreductase [Acinetobacter sp. ANC 5378]|uniref:LLM class flavin-dependent oxidoreductase n=1 Tax=Acinetobacter sp. ANC 5378 TaxID=2731249 RepID=UPI00148FD892|nr:LLM class flavin-dependent oxidoreductase [Acinetobacter sp. ANC 5378]NNG81612.1 LLM class flavin-dependent oxidoreductase [Acinetobacter sp. ANC 5378]